jgi:hypothetical protein
VSFIYSQARNEQAAGNYILPIGQNVLQQALVRYAAQSASAYLARVASNVTAINALVAAPQTISPAVAFTMVNLHPYSATVAQAIGLVGFIYLLIFAFVLTMNWYAAREIMAPFLTTKTLLVARIALPLFLYFWISLIFAMLNLPFKVPFGAKFTYAGGELSPRVVLPKWCNSVELTTDGRARFFSPRCRILPVVDIPLGRYGIFGSCDGM